MAIYQTDRGVYVISSHQVWLPGRYDSERAARYAFRFDEAVLSRLHARVGSSAITLEMLREEARINPTGKRTGHGE